MSAAWRTGYVNRPTLPSFFCPLFIYGGKDRVHKTRTVKRSKNKSRQAERDLFFLLKNSLPFSAEADDFMLVFFFVFSSALRTGSSVQSFLWSSGGSPARSGLHSDDRTDATSKLGSNTTAKKEKPEQKTKHLLHKNAETVSK